MKTHFKKKLLRFTVVTVLAATASLSYAQAASTTANATASVIAAIAISKTSDMDFGEGIQGDGAQVMAPGGSGHASFGVTGEPNRAYTVTLPADGDVTLTTGDGVGATKQLPITSFTSNPAAGANGLLSGGGAQTLNVGATRSAIAANQVTGAYTATFTVTVVY